ncbi:tetratricopeptide repeat (TPR)-like superfamily protein [Tasmannia lanceolata]|uniref:tetratricopeptide repeat (TPR)-like superfamily protein n=1 Tax=Tasmannia lanceolata TaxID=3420 RepID=UPI004063DA18
MNGNWKVNIIFLGEGTLLDACLLLWVDSLHLFKHNNGYDFKFLKTQYFFPPVETMKRLGLNPIVPSLVMVVGKLLAMVVPSKTHLHSHTIRSRGRKRQRPNTTIFNNKEILLPLLHLQRRGASSIDSFTLLSCCAKTSSLAQGKQIHCVVIRLGFESLVFLQTSLIKMYSVMGDLEDAHRVFNGISHRKRSVVCWTALISAYVDNGKSTKALNLFRLMQTENVEPDRVTITVALSACAHLGALDVGEWIHAYISRKKGFETDLSLHNALINMYSKCGDIDTSRRLFDKFSRRDITTWTSMIVGHALHGQAEEALTLFAKLKDNNNNGDDGAGFGSVIPNQVTFIGVLMACSHAGLLQQGLHHLESMSEDYGLKPQISHFGCIVDLFCRAGLLKEAYDFIRKMPIQPNALVWRTLLAACMLHGNLELGLHVRHRVLELEPNYVGDAVSISNMYAAAGMWNDKSTVRKQIKQQRRAPGCSLIEVESTIHEFVVADKHHPQRREIYSLLQGMVNILTSTSDEYAVEASDLVDNEVIEDGVRQRDYTI